MIDARPGPWDRVLIYLELIEPPAGYKSRRIIPWWLVLVVAAMVLARAAMVLRSGSFILGVGELFIAAVVARNAFTRHRNT